MPLFFNIASLITVSLVGFLYWLGVQEGYLFTYQYLYDIPLHLLGGLTAGFWTMAGASRMRLPPRRALVLTFAVILPVAVLWEVMEYATGLTVGEQYYILDTIKDIIDGTLGALAAWSVYTLLIRTR